MNTQFGTGVVVCTPTTGNLATTPSIPQVLPVLQEVQVEFKGDLKKLYGMQQFALAKARGKIDVSGKGKIIVPTPDVLSQLFFGQPTSTGLNRPVYLESHTPAASVTPSNLTANANLAVINGTTGLPMTPISTGSPTVGQYKFTPYNSTGPVSASYAFNASETAATVQLCYTWPDTAGLSLVVNNELMGYAPEMQFVLFNTFRNKLMSLQLNSVVFGMISVPTKQEDFWLADFDFEASCDNSGVLGIFSADL